MSHHHECHSDSSCEAEHQHECCCHHACACECHKKHKYYDELLALADDAWMEVLKDLIKEDIIKKSGDHLKQLAELVSQTNHKRWSAKMEEKSTTEHFQDELKQLMCSKKK
jgi:hypothetical protein